MENSIKLPQNLVNTIVASRGIIFYLLSQKLYSALVISGVMPPRMAVLYEFYSFHSPKVTFQTCTFQHKKTIGVLTKMKALLDFMKNPVHFLENDPKSRIIGIHGKLIFLKKVTDSHFVDQISELQTLLWQHLALLVEAL